MNELTKKSAFGIAGMAGIAAVALAMGVAGPAMASTSNTGIAATSTVSDTSQHQTSSNQWKSTDFRAAQEAFMNVHKHANAARVQITLRRALGAIELGIADDGVGPGPESERGYGVGLEGMRKRLAELNGALAVTALEPGFHLLVTCPAIL